LLTTGSLLHPRISLAPNAVVADIGCGTGIWSLSLSQNLTAGCRIEASDISLAQAPPEPWWPSNVSFRTLDVFEDPLPEEHVGCYDVIHIRLFVFVIASGNPLPLLKNLIRLLKPGGWLQWQEYDNSELRTMTAYPELQPTALKAVLDEFKALQSKVTTTANWVHDFHEKVGKAGVGAELVAHERTWTAQEALMTWQDCAFLGLREWCDAIRRQGEGMVSIAERLEGMTAEAEKECIESGRGVLIDGQYVTWVIRKQE
jgi:SAM-dependent methyltransferase